MARTTNTPSDPTAGAPPPPDDAGGSGGGNNRDDDKLLIMYCLESALWRPVWAIAGYCKLRICYTQELLEELEEAGLVWFEYKRWSRDSRWIERVVSGRTPTMAQELRTGLTENGRNDPELVKLCEAISQANQEERESMSRGPEIVAFGSVGLGAIVILVYTAGTILDLF